MSQGFLKTKCVNVACKICRITGLKFKLLSFLLQICNIQNYGTKKLYWNCKILLKDVEESRGSGEFKIHDTYSETAKHAELWLYANLLHLILYTHVLDWIYQTTKSCVSQ